MLKQIIVWMSLPIIILIIACGGQEKPAETGEKMGTEERKEEFGNKGIGEVKDVPLYDSVNTEMAMSGKAIYEMKCSSCHKLNDERVVGPGWAGITNNRTPEWIMNMITNVDIMLASDPEAQKLLEECLVRMPNQNVSVGDARDILEFMRQNDVETVGKRDEAAQG